MIQLDRVSFSYGGLKVFENLAFSLGRGEFVVISGPARSGKTTLVQLICGLIMPESGDIMIAGDSIRQAGRSRSKLRGLRRRIGGIGGIFALIGDRTVLENIALPLEISGTPFRAARKAAVEACGRYRLSHVAGRFPAMVSEAERRLAQIARAETTRKELIVADSPADGLDTASARFINERLTSLHLAGASILYITSGLGPETGPNRRLVLRQGTIAE